MTKLFCRCWRQCECLLYALTGSPSWCSQSMSPFEVMLMSMFCAATSGQDGIHTLCSGWGSSDVHRMGCYWSSRWGPWSVLPTEAMLIPVVRVTHRGCPCSFLLPKTMLLSLGHVDARVHLESCAGVWLANQRSYWCPWPVMPWKSMLVSMLWHRTMLMSTVCTPTRDQTEVHGPG